MFPPSKDAPTAAGNPFAAALRARRLLAGLTQRDLAMLSGVAVRTIREVERARVSRPHRGTVELLADALSLTGVEREAFFTAARRCPPPLGAEG